MSDYDTPLLADFPEGVLRASGGTISFLNTAARRILPGLTPGMPLPEFFTTQPSAPMGAGSFSTEAGRYVFTASQSGGEQLFMLRPAPRPALTGPQLDGTLRQLRVHLGEMLVELGGRTNPDAPSFVGADFLKSFYRLFRLMDNAEFLQMADDPDGPGFHPITMDLAGLCNRLCMEAGGLLRECGITLTLQCKLPSLLIPGDPQLLRRMLLELISNSSKVSTGGEVVVSLHRSGTRALLTISDSGGTIRAGQLAQTLLAPGPTAIPQPGQGAGLGLSIVQHIVALHKGALLSDCVDDSPRLVISLPTGPLSTRSGVCAPVLDTNGGLNPLLVGLSDVLPARLFSLEGMD